MEMICWRNLGMPICPLGKTNVFLPRLEKDKKCMLFQEISCWSHSPDWTVRWDWRYAIREEEVIGHHRLLLQSLLIEDYQCWSSRSVLVRYHPHTWSCSAWLWSCISRMAIHLTLKIPLLNVYYKILAKVLAKRLKAVIRWMIHPGQTCSFPDWRITNSLALIVDMVHYIQGRWVHEALIILDQEKDFDQECFEYMGRALCKMGLGYIECSVIISTWCSLIFIVRY